MTKYTLGEVAVERKEVCKGDKSQYPIVGLEHLMPSDINLGGYDQGTENTFSKVFRKGDILFGRRRAYLKKAAMAPFEGICSGDITVITALPDKILPELLPFIIQNDQFFDFAVGKSAGSLSPRVKWENLKKYKFNLPNLAEQKKLAQVLWAAENTRQAYKKLLLQTDQLIKAKFIEMFGKTDKKRLSEIASITMGQSPASNTYNETGDGMPFYQGKTEFGDMYVTTKMYCSAPNKKAIAGDILLSVRAPVGAVNLTRTDCCIGRGLAAIHGLKNKANTLYLFYALRVLEDDVVRMGQGATFLAINKDHLYNFMIPAPSLKLQNTFVEFMQKAEAVKSETLASLDNLNSMTRTIINNTLKGEL